MTRGLDSGDLSVPAPCGRAAEEEESVVVQPEMLPAPEQDNIFQTGKPVKIMPPLSLS